VAYPNFVVESQWRQHASSLVCQKYLGGKGRSVTHGVSHAGRVCFVYCMVQSMSDLVMNLFWIPFLINGLRKKFASIFDKYILGGT
jgi:hypothetical protein